MLDWFDRLDKRFGVDTGWDDTEEERRRAFRRVFMQMLFLGVVGSIVGFFVGGWNAVLTLWLFVAVAGVLGLVGRALLYAWDSR